jgi:predicted DNA-binding transcriptional regulator YafY
VRLGTASVGWLVRSVPQHGASAEVIDPPACREAVRRALEFAARAQQGFSAAPRQIPLSRPR